MKKLALLLAGASALAAQQAVLRPGATESPQQSPATGVIGGTVIDVTTGEPMPKVLVHVALARSRTNARIVATTDDQGRFTAEKITPGPWTFNLYRNGFVPTEASSTGTLRSGDVIEVGPGQIVDDLVLGLQPAAVINGRVVDEDGAPMEGMVVEASRYRYVEGARELLVVGRATSNDRGEYRIYGLHPGDYYLRVNLQSLMAQTSLRASLGGNTGYVDTYYPNAQDVSQAGMLRVTAEAETVGIELRMARTATLSVSVRVVDPTGQPTLGSSLALLDRSKSGRQINPRRLEGGPDGRFKADGLKPGSYRVEGMVFARDRTRSFAVYDFELSDRSLEDLTIQAKPTFSVAGRVVIEGDIGEDANLPSLVALEPEGAFSLRGGFSPVKEDGQLLFESVVEDFYRVRARDLRGLYLKSARYDGRDAVAEPVRVVEGGGEFVVVFSANGARVNGQVARDGEGVAGARVALIPEDRAKTDHVKSSATDQYGVFNITGIAPGRYKVFAWEQIEHSAWLDPNVLAPFESQGVLVELEEGDAKRVTPKLIEAKD